MQVSISQKVKEVSIDAQLAALKEICDQKDFVDQRISELASYRIKLSSTSYSTIEKEVSKEAAEITQRILDFHSKEQMDRLVQRREGLIAKALLIMSSCT